MKAWIYEGLVVILLQADRTPLLGGSRVVSATFFFRRLSSPLPLDDVPIRAHYNTVRLCACADYISGLQGSLISACGVP